MQMRKHYTGFITLILVLASATTLRADAKSDLNALTGGLHTRVAWREGGHMWSHTDLGWAIKGFDSQTGQQTTIYTGSGKLQKSVIAAGGHKILVTDQGADNSYKLFVVDWNGSNAQMLAAPAMVTDGYRDSQGNEWAYYRANGSGDNAPIWRVRLDDSSKKEKVHDGKHGHEAYSWFQISGDGKYAADFFPWTGGQGGIVDLQTGTKTIVTGGCWSSMASDNSYRWFRLDGAHTGLVTFKGTSSKASFSANPPISPNVQMYCPRAAEGPQHGGDFFTLCGGYPGKNTNGNTVEVFVGKFSGSTDGWTGVSGWARITNDNVTAQHPGVWVGVESGAASIELSTDKVQFTADEGGSNPSSKNVTVTASGDAGTVTAADDKDWLGLSISQSGSEWTIVNNIDISGLETGVYTATVTVNAPNAIPSSKSYAVELTIEGVPVATEISISPSTVALKPGDTKSFSAQVKDQFGDLIDPQPSISWSVNSPATIDNDGKFTAPGEEGDYTVTAQTSGITASASVTVSAATILTLTSSHEGNTYNTGKTVTISWTATDDIGVNIFISPNSGLEWFIVNGDAGIQTNSGQGSFDWVVESEVEGVSVTGTGMIFKIVDYWDNTVSDQSGTFTIEEGPSLHLKINCGGESSGDWVSDATYDAGGNAYDFGSTPSTDGVTNPAPGAVYQTCRHGNHNYDIDVPDGDYKVRIHWMDTHGTGRAMVYTIEGEEVLSGFNPADEAGGTGKAVVKEWCITVDDGNGLQIDVALGSGNDAFQSAIEVIAGGGCSSPVKWMSGRTAEALQTDIVLTQMAGGKYRLLLPNDAREVAIYSADGSLFSMPRLSGFQTAVKLPSGAFIVRCTVNGKRLIRKIVVGR